MLNAFYFSFGDFLPEQLESSFGLFKYLWFDVIKLETALLKSVSEVAVPEGYTFLYFISRVSINEPLVRLAVIGSFMPYST